jgi:hypothetical protein
MIPYPTLKDVRREALAGVPGAKLIIAAILLLIEFEGRSAEDTYAAILNEARK